MSHRFTLLFMCCAAAFSAVQSSGVAGTIVPDIDDTDSSLVFSATTPTTTSTDHYAPTLSNGVTLAAQLTPNQADVDSPADAAVAVIETGGTTSGSGIWLIGGNYWFLTSAGSSSALPSDNDGSDNGIGVNLGAAVAGQQNQVWASFDGANALLKGSVNGVVTDYPLVNVSGTWNWTGNDSVSLGQVDGTVTGANFGFRGGLVDGLTAPAMFDTNAAVDLDGTVSLGQVFNSVSTIPEPSGLVLAMLFAVGLAAKTR